MKRSKTKLTFAAAFASLGTMIGISGCGVNGLPSEEPASGVYGPPTEIDGPVEPVYGPPPADVEEPGPEVYGPPEYFEGESDDTGKEEPEPDVYSEEPMVDVYGPPEYFGIEVEEPEATVYGPPEYFGNETGD